jgi:hypothetical protein
MIASAFTLPASMSERASGIEHGDDLHAAGHEVLQPGAAPLDGHPRHGSRIEALVLEQPASARCQMPPCPVPEALNLPGFAFTAASRSFTDL